MAYAREYTIDLGAGATGLSLRYRLWDTTGAYIAAATGTSGERGATGCYALLVTAPAGHRGGVDFLDAADGTTILLSAAINPEESEYLDTTISSRAAAGVPVTVSSRLTGADGTTWTLEIGDDYGGSPTNLQRFTLALGAGLYPDLTGGSIALYITGYTGAQGTGVVVTGSPTAAQSVAVDFTAAQSAAYSALAGTSREMTLRATTSGGQVQTLISRGTLAFVTAVSS